MSLFFKSQVKRVEMGKKKKASYHVQAENKNIHRQKRFLLILDHGLVMVELEWLIWLSNTAMEVCDNTTNFFSQIK